MTDRHDKMRVPPDPSLAEALRQRLHARIASASPDDHEGRSHLSLDAARLKPEQQLLSVEENYVSIDSLHTSEVKNRRRVAMAAAAVVAVIGVAAIAINSTNSDNDVEPSPAAATAVAPTTAAPRRETGAYTPFTYTVPDGWGPINAGVVSNGSTASTTEWRPGGPAACTPAQPCPRSPTGVIFEGVVDLPDGHFYTYYCRSARLIGAPVGPTVDDLASALANLPGVGATAASDITIDGFDGKQIEFTVPTYNEEDCNGLFSECSFGLGPGETPPTHVMQCGNELHGRANQHLKIWILDVDGSRWMIVAWSSPDSSQQDRAALDEVLASIQIG